MSGQKGKFMTNRIRVLLADDHAVVRKGIRDFLLESGDIEIVAEAADGLEAQALIEQHQPDVAVLDIQMPGQTGIEVTRWLRSQRLPTGVLILTAFDDDPYILAVLQAGANGYVLKTAEASDIIEAVRSVYEGQSALDARIARKLVNLMGGREREPALPTEPLSDREMEVLHLAARGYTNKSIGVQLAISDRTVQGHLARVYEKLHASSRTEAVMRAVALGWITPDAVKSTNQG